MKLSNAPGRKLQRRLGALKRLGPIYKKSGAANDTEREVLKSRTSIGMDRARAIRTKKDRSARAKIARA